MLANAKASAAAVFLVAVPAATTVSSVSATVLEAAAISLPAARVTPSEAATPAASVSSVATSAAE